jgi:transferase CAF17, mitochondrial
MHRHVPTISTAPCHLISLKIKGRVLNDIFVYTQPAPSGQQGYLIEYDTPTDDAIPLLPLLKRHVLRAKVRVRDVSEDYDTWAAWGSENEKLWDTERSWQWARSGAVEPDWGVDTRPWGSEHFTLNDRRAIGMGVRALVKKGEKR